MPGTDFYLISDKIGRRAMKNMYSIYQLQFEINCHMGESTLRLFMGNGCVRPNHVFALGVFALCGFAPIETIAVYSSR